MMQKTLNLKELHFTCINFQGKVLTLVTWHFKGNGYIFMGDNFVKVVCLFSEKGSTLKRKNLRPLDLQSDVLLTALWSPAELIETIKVFSLNYTMFEHTMFRIPIRLATSGISILFSSINYNY